MSTALRASMANALGLFRRLRSIRNVVASEPTDEKLSSTCLYEHMSYRLPEAAGRDPLIGFRMIMRVWKRTSGDRTERLYEEGGNAIVVGGIPGPADTITAYIARSSGAAIRAYIAKDHIPCRPVIRSSMGWWVFAVLQALRALTDRRRANVALTIAEVAECAWIVAYCERHGIRQVYDFIPYEVDGNALSVLLREKGIRVTKIPSSGPLKTHNSIVLGDELICSSAYHLEELPHLPYIRTPRHTLWPPERAFTYIDVYLSRPGTPRHTIGYYSHGEWLRRAEGHAFHGMDILTAEDTILRDLAAYLAAHPACQLVVFPHPREKHPDWTERATAFYRSYFGDLPVELAGKETITARSFHRVDVAVSAFSAINFERLFCGYKLLIGNKGIDDFPRTGSPLHAICFRDRERMFTLLDQALEMDDDTFYRRHGLVGYRYLDHPELPGLVGAADRS